MTVEEIQGLPLPELAADDAALFLWTPVRLLPEALRVVEQWGFAYCGTITMVKNRLGLGTWLRTSSEHVLLAVRGGIRPRPGHNVRSWFEAPAGRRRHLAKPSAFYELVERMFPEGPYLELFARGRPRHRWVAWGDEAEPAGRALDQHPGRA